MTTDFSKLCIKPKHMSVRTITLTSTVNKDGTISHKTEESPMIRPTVFNKVVSELNELRLNMLVATKYAEDRKSVALLFDIALNAIYKELRAQKKPHQPELL